MEGWKEVVLDYLKAFGDTALKQLSVLTAQPDVVRIDLNEINLQFILVASDGFWDVLTNEQAVHSARTFLRASSNQWHKVAEYLVRKALELGSDDNISLLFIRLL
uniref:PPM-type phosphatase domain-containing protein n=1 Tax=Elaeophora elaphi TaxID=1147741 RepID=A0A0R3RNG1_9BILA